MKKFNIAKSGKENKPDEAIQQLKAELKEMANRLDTAEKELAKLKAEKASK